MYFEIPGTRIRVMGSMHLLPRGSENLPEWAMQAYEWSEELVFEASSSALPPEEWRMDGDNGLRFKLSRATWGPLEKIWPTAPEFPPIDQVHLWAVFIFGPMFALKAVDGVEPVFQKLAASESKPVFFLESGAEIVAAFSSAPPEDVLKSLEYLVKDLSEPQRTLIKMTTHWARGDLAKLGEVAFRSPSFKFESVRLAMLKKRNEAWTPKLGELIESSKRTLVVVGALHLYGPGNLFECWGVNPGLLIQQ